MKPEHAVEVTDITKKFRVYLDKGHTLKEKTLFRKRRAYERRTVLNGVSFAVRKGEAVGLIGHNGCGKSTILKLLTRIMYPDSGKLEMSGRVSSLIELGAGFHPDMSGRENIYINASIFGLSKQEIDRRMEDIIAFSELEEFMDHPVRTYSSGMYMRLAFSVAIHVDADILLIDEILAVGDAGFQAKCFKRLKEIKSKGTTIIIVSHSLGQIEQICDRSIWIHDGTVRAQGKPQDVHAQYLEYMGQKNQAAAEKEEQKEPPAGQERQSAEQKEPPAGQEIRLQEEKKLRWGNGKIQFEAVHLLDGSATECTSFTTDAKMAIRMDYYVKESVKDAVFGIGIFRIDGVHCYGTNTRIDKLEAFQLEKGTSGFVRFEIDAMALLPGIYLLDVAVVEGDKEIPVDFYREARRFEVFSEVKDIGVVRLKHQWKIRNRGEAYDGVRD